MIEEASVSAESLLGPLLGLVPSEHGADEQVDWHAAEEALGVCLPSDYKAFMSVYGAGGLGDLGILGPLPVEYSQWDPGNILDNAPEFRDLWDSEGGVDTQGSKSMHRLGVLCPDGRMARRGLGGSST